MLFIGFAILALGLAAVVLYAALSYAVSLHAAEIVIRTALRADAAGVERLFLTQEAARAAAGLCDRPRCGAGAHAFCRVAAFRILPRDRVAYVVAPS